MVFVRALWVSLYLAITVKLLNYYSIQYSHRLLLLPSSAMKLVNWNVGKSLKNRTNIIVLNAKKKKVHDSVMKSKEQCICAF